MGLFFVFWKWGPIWRFPEMSHKLIPPDLCREPFRAVKRCLPWTPGSSPGE